MKSSTKVWLVVGAIVFIYIVSNIIGGLSLALPHVLPVFGGPIVK